MLRGVVTFQNDQHTGALPGRLVRNEKMIGLSGIEGVAPAAGDEALGKDTDLTKHALELSRDGGASAVARVLRHQEEDQEQARSRL